MPYKHIASKLKKTELACRLHYHQLSFGSKSRRAPAIHNFERCSASPPDKRKQSETPTPQRALPTFSPPASPPQAIEYNPTDRSNTPQSQNKPILPKPIPSIHQRTLSATQPLRLVTADMDRYHERQYVDTARLDRIYEAHRLHFWSTIARSYGCSLSPAVLEEAWCRAHGMGSSNFPPTPRGSPKGSPSSLQAPSSSLSNIAPYAAAPRSAIGGREENPKPATTRNNSFSVSSLLTENKEVRSPSRERKAEDVEMSSS